MEESEQIIFQTLRSLMEDGVSLQEVAVRSRMKDDERANQILALLERKLKPPFKSPVIYPNPIDEKQANIVFQFDTLFNCLPRIHGMGRILYDNEIEATFYLNFKELDIRAQMCPTGGYPYKILSVHFYNYGIKSESILRIIPFIITEEHEYSIRITNVMSNKKEYRYKAGVIIESNALGKFETMRAYLRWEDTYDNRDKALTNYLDVCKRFRRDSCKFDYEIDSWNARKYAIINQYI